MKFVGVVHIYVYHTLTDFGLFIFKNDCFIAVVLKAILNTADNGYQGYWPRLRIISLQHRTAVCARTP